jgi:hypothetical protein
MTFDKDIARVKLGLSGKLGPFDHYDRNSRLPAEC